MGTAFTAVMAGSAARRPAVSVVRAWPRLQVLYGVICPPAAALIILAFWPMWRDRPLLALASVILSMALLSAGILLLDEPSQQGSAGTLIRATRPPTGRRPRPAPRRGTCRDGPGGGPACHDRHLHGGGVPADRRAGRLRRLRPATPVRADPGGGPDLALARPGAGIVNHQRAARHPGGPGPGSSRGTVVGRAARRRPAGHHDRRGPASRHRGRSLAVDG